MTPAEDNLKGFFENQQIVDFNEKLLNVLGLNWSSWQAFPENWQETLGDSQLEAAAKLLNDEFERADAICIKDPRICRLLPFWLRVLADQQFEIYCVLTTRQPGEVISSLKSRDGMGKAQASALWLRYNLDAMQGSVSRLGMHISYDEVLSDPEGALDRISELVGMQLEMKDQSFVDFGLRHHKDHALPEWAALVLRNAERFPEVPDSGIETLALPLLSQAAEWERLAQGEEIIDIEGLSDKETRLFNQAEEAKQYALSLSLELETGRRYITDLEREQDTGRQYITDLEREQDTKDKLIQSQEASLQEAKERFDRAAKEGEAYAETLKSEVEEARQYSEALNKALAEKESELVQRDADLQEIIDRHQSETETREVYTQSLQSALEGKEAELVTAHAELEKMHRELRKVHQELAETHQRLIDRTQELEAELQRFKLQRRMIKMLQQVTDG